MVSRSSRSGSSTSWYGSLHSVLLVREELKGSPEGIKFAREFEEDPNGSESGIKSARKFEGSVCWLLRNRMPGKTTVSNVLGDLRGVGGEIRRDKKGRRKEGVGGE